MNVLFPCIRISLAVLAYIVFAISASIVTRKAGGNLKDMEGRTSQLVLAIGAIANLCVLAVTLLLLRFLDRRPLAALGLSFFGRDLIFSIVAVAAIFALAVAFIGWLRRTGRYSAPFSLTPT